MQKSPQKIKMFNNTGSHDGWKFFFSPKSAKMPLIPLFIHLIYIYIKFLAVFSNALHRSQKNVYKAPETKLKPVLLTLVFAIHAFYTDATEDLNRGRKVF